MKEQFSKNGPTSLETKRLSQNRKLRMRCAAPCVQCVSVLSSFHSRGQSSAVTSSSSRGYWVARYFYSTDRRHRRRIKTFSTLPRAPLTTMRTVCSYSPAFSARLFKIDTTVDTFEGVIMQLMLTPFNCSVGRGRYRTWIVEPASNNVTSLLQHNVKCYKAQLLLTSIKLTGT